MKNPSKNLKNPSKVVENNKKKKSVKFKSILKFFLLILVSFVIVCIWNFDKISSILPSKYVFIYNKINNAIFGKVQVIEIVGNDIISKNDILNYTYKEKVSDDDLKIVNNEAEIIKSLKQNPIIEFVSIRRFLPNKMVIYIKEKKLILRLWDSSLQQFFSISKDGEIINFYDPKLKLPLVINNYDTKSLIKLYNKLNEYKIIEHVTDINSFFDYRFDIVLNRTTLVNLPESNIDAGLNVLINLINENGILSKNIKQIDLRVEGKIVVKYFEKTEEAIYKPISSYKVFTWQ